MKLSTRRQFLNLTLAAAGAVAVGRSTQTAHSASQYRRRSSQAAAPNIVMVVADALRADHVSAYGYGRGTTPNLDAMIADQGVQFRRAVSAAPWTYAANAALVTGQSPTRLAATWDVAGLPAATPTLAELLHAAGYQTAGFNSARLVRQLHGFGRGFDHYDDSVADGNPHEAQDVAQAINERVSSWLNTSWQPDKPLFLFIYYFDPHTWYNPPAPYDTLYDNSYTGTLTPSVIEDGKGIVAGTIVPTPRDLEHILALYDGEIAYTDARFGELMADLQTRNLLENTLIAVTAHGEIFGDHGKWVHAGSLYEEELRVPLLLRYSGVIGANQSMDVPVSNMDLMPTILEYAGVSIPANLSAASLRPLIEGAKGPGRDIFAEVDGMNDPDHWVYWNASRVDLRTVYRGDWKYIHHVGHEESDELYLLGATRSYETENRILVEPELAASLRTAIKGNFGLWRTSLPFVTRT